MRFPALLPLRCIFVCLGVAFAGITVHAAGEALFSSQLNLPAQGVSQRVTLRPDVQPGQTFTLFDEQGPACILHWWLTCSPGLNPDTKLGWQHQLRVRFYYDGAKEPAVDMTLAQYFAILLNREPYPVRSAAIKVLPKNAFNSYFPIPFRSLRIELENRGPRAATIWFMADWQQYPQNYPLTPLRFRAVFKQEDPAERFGTIHMADFEGRGFIAGMVQAVDVADNSDRWFHTGGDTYLLDGETAPRPLRGIGGEDVFNMSFGIWPEQNDWVGAPLTERKDADSGVGSGYDGVMYRIFGPDPIFFETSASLRFGTKANHTESVIYAYVEAKSAPTILAPRKWQLAGPFACANETDFERHEWAENNPAQWPKEHVADFGVYLSKLKGLPPGPTTFPVPVVLSYEHGWCNFVHAYQGRGLTNDGAQPHHASAYALGRVQATREGDYTLHLGYDDWMKVWVNGREVHHGRHDHGFGEDTVNVRLPAGETTVLVKLSNFDNIQWRLWAFALRFTPTPATAGQ